MGTMMMSAVYLVVLMAWTLTSGEMITFHFYSYSAALCCVSFLENVEGVGVRNETFESCERLLWQIFFCDQF